MVVIQQKSDNDWFSNRSAAWWMIWSFIITSIQCIEEVYWFESHYGFFFELFGFGKDATRGDFLAGVIGHKTVQLMYSLVVIAFPDTSLGKAIVKFHSMVFLVACGFVFTVELILSRGRYVTGAVLGLLAVTPFHCLMVRELWRRKQFTSRSLWFYVFFATGLGSVVIVVTAPRM